MTSANHTLLTDLVHLGVTGARTHNATMATVLVVDDEPIVREVVVRYLAREGHRTLEAGDGDARA